MSKVYGIHELELNPGVTGEEFEQFIAGEGAVLFPSGPGKGTLVKGDRGARAGKYAILLEYSSVDERNQAFPQQDEAVEVIEQRVPDDVRRALEQFARLASGLGHPSSYTDYVAVGE